MKIFSFSLKKYKICILVCTALIFFGCAVTYHTKSTKYQTQIQEGLYDKAYKNIESIKFLKKKRNTLLYHFEKGKIAHLNGFYKESNALFNKADFIIEDARKNLKDEIIGIVTNPEKTIYKGEDFEKVAIHYYKALNYIFLNQIESAIVETKRINLQLQKINDKYPESKKNRYKSDAFALNLQGLLYEAAGNTNDAFISYRNSVDLYLKNKGNYFGVSIPKQLKIDLLRTANLMGFVNEEEKYAKIFKMTYTPLHKKKYGEAIIFWENGLIPYKDQNFYTFVSSPKNGLGLMGFSNKDLGIDFVLPAKKKSNEKGDLSDIHTFSVSFPKYIHRKPYYETAKVVVDSTSYPLFLAQNYDAIAFKTLKDRTLREIGKIALRIAVKKTSEYVLRNQNKELGALLGAYNLLSERSDTRNWQTLPNTISYARIPLKKGENKIQLIVKETLKNKITKEFLVQGTGSVKFLNYATPKSISN